MDDQMELWEEAGPLLDSGASTAVDGEVDREGRTGVGSLPDKTYIWADVGTISTDTNISSMRP